MKLTSQQCLVMWCGLIVITAMCIYVPWRSPAHQKVRMSPDWIELKEGRCPGARILVGLQHSHVPKHLKYDTVHVDADCGYRFVFMLSGSQRLDFGRLVLQCCVVVLLVTGLMITPYAAQESLICWVRRWRNQQHRASVNRED